MTVFEVDVIPEANSAIVWASVTDTWGETCTNSMEWFLSEYYKVVSLKTPPTMKSNLT